MSLRFCFRSLMVQYSVTFLTASVGRFPCSLLRRYFDAIYLLSHPCFRATIKLIAARFVRQGMNKDVCGWVQFFLSCQRSKIPRHTVSPLGPFGTACSKIRVCTSYFDECSHLLTLVDCFLRWPEAIPLSDISAPIDAQAFLDG